MEHLDPGDFQHHQAVPPSGMRGRGRATRPPRGPDLPDEVRRRQLEGLLDKLDAQSAADPERHHRRAQRTPFRRFGVPVSLHHPGGSTTIRHVLTRDLSTGGVSFLHNGFLYVGTRADVVLQRHGGGQDLHRGHVVHCTHVSGTWHHVGVRFEQKLFPRLYLDPDLGGTMEMESVEPSTITGRVLHLDDQEVDRRLLAHFLRHTRIELMGCGCIGDAVPHIAKGGFDLVLTDVYVSEVPNGPHIENIVKALRDAGHGGSVAVLTAETDPRRLQQVRSSGVCGILTKPYQGDQLLSAMANWLNTKSRRASDEKIHSTLALQPEMQPMVREFVASARAMADSLQKAVAEQNFESCRTICVRLRGSGSGYGFGELTEAADDAVKALDASQSVDERAVQALQDACRRLSADPPEAAAPPPDEEELLESISAPAPPPLPGDAAGEAA